MADEMCSDVLPMALAALTARSPVRRKLGAAGNLVSGRRAGFRDTAATKPD
jgi:hypothetical protein